MPTTDYNKPIDDYADLLSMLEYSVMVAQGVLSRYDGHGLACKDGKASTTIVIPGEPHRIPADATHVAWYNK